jgi:hypothetical protein
LDGITSYKLARANHTHSQYQPVDPELTAIAALAVDNGNIIVGNGTTWVAESGATARASLGLGSLATLSSVSNANFSGTDLAIVNGGTGASTAENARTNLGLVIGEDILEQYDLLESLGEELEDQEEVDQLIDLSKASAANGNFLVGNGTKYVVESGATVRASLGLGSLATLSSVNNANFSGTDLAIVNGGTGASTEEDARTNLGLAIGSDVQAYSARLADIAGLAVTSGNIIVADGTNWVAVDDLFTNRPTIFYNTTTGAVAGSLILADVTAI